ncbi:hypothetical protein M2149_002359 [Lachnospiraceae bacterium PFB1-21]
MYIEKFFEPSYIHKNRICGTQILFFEGGLTPNFLIGRNFRILIEETDLGNVN